MTRFAGVGVATAANPATENSRNVAHLGAISGGQEVERKVELEADLVTPRRGGTTQGRLRAELREALDGNSDGASAIGGCEREAERVGER